MNEKKACQCSSGPKLIFACSGAADVGEISDRAGRKMRDEGVGQMFCLAGIGGRIDPIMKQTEAADKILAIDGCGLDCVKRTLEVAGFENFAHLRVTDMDMEKGKSPPTEERIRKAAQKAGELISC